MPLRCLASLRAVRALVAVTAGLVAREAAAQEATPPPPPTPAAAPVAPSPTPPAGATPRPADSFGTSLVGPAPPPQTVVLSAPQPAAPAPERHPMAFRADFKLPFTVSTLSTGGEGGGLEQNPFAPVPQLVLGFHVGRIGLGAGLGFTRIGVTTSEVSFSGGATSASNSIAEILIAPTLTVDVFQSDDGKVAFYVLGAPIFGDILITGENSESDLGFQFALGANLALHENFRLGLEVGPVGHFYSGEENESASTISLYTALVGTFVYPR